MSSSTGSIDDVIMSLWSCIRELNSLDRNNGDQVEFDETFMGKYVLIFCFQQPRLREDFESIFPIVLIDTCSELYHMRDDFEMVAVTKTSDSVNDFNFFLSYFSPSCLVVPFKDSKHRNYLCEYLGLVHPGFKCVLVNVERNISCCGDRAIEYLQKLFPERPIDFLTFFNRLVKSTWPVIPKEQKNPRQCEGTCPIARQLKVVVPEYPDDIGKMVSESKKSCRPIEIGRYFDVLSLLSGKGESNYLIRNGGGRVEVEDETFRGKYIMVCCFHVPVFREDDHSLYLQGLVTTCSDLYSTKGDFEMVVVAKMNTLANYEEVFNHFMSGFPSSCLVVPFKNSKRRDFICKYLNFDGICKCLILDDNRSVLFHGHDNFAIDYGADGFPFTEEHLQKLSTKDMPLWQTSSTSNLEGLLQCNPTSVIDRINSAGVLEEVTISELNKKLVGLYLCVRGLFIPTLHKVYQQCITQQLAIEIVLVYLPFGDCLDPQVFKVKMDSLLQKQKIYWWRLPFNNSVSRRLERLSCSDYYDNKLIIVGPYGEFVDPYGGEIVSGYGVDVYPFTRKGLVERELNKLRELTLELLVHGSRDYVLRGKDKVAVAELQGRNILLYFDCLDDLELYEKLLTWYREIQAKGTDLEVVFVRRNNMNTREVEDDLVVSAMPWLVCPFDPDHSAPLKKIFWKGGGTDDTLVQFGQNGQICSFRAQELLTVRGPNAFPFGDNLREDVISKLSGLHWFMENMK